MIKLHFLHRKSDLVGSVASTLCLVHCVATPLLFVAPIRHWSNSGSTLFWWSKLDFLFLGISFLAVYFSAKNTSKNVMKYGLWLSWMSLAGILINEKLHFLQLREEIIYIPTIALIILHFYNRMYCQCSNEKCCAHHLNGLRKNTN